MKIELSKPFKYENQEYTELDLPIENITVTDYEKAEREFKALNPKFVGAVELESAFYKHMACNLVGKPIDFFDNMPVYEFIKIKTQVQSFLLTGTVLEI